MAITLMEALHHFDAAEANLTKLERLWDEIESLYPDGRNFGDYAAYEERCFAFNAVLEAIPKIDGWKPSIRLYDAEEVGQMRLDGKRLLRTVLRATSPFTMMEAAWPFIVRFDGATKSTRELTAWPTATGEHTSIR